MELGLDTGGKGVVDRLVELDENSKSQGGCQHMKLKKLIKTFLYRDDSRIF